jgi:uncharacterized protein involved in exopolysaccharide biosynthesis
MSDRREYEGEAEVDLGRYVSAVAARWWLPLLGLVVGVVLGLGVSVGGEDVFKGTAVLYLGQPYIGNARVDTLATTPGHVREIVTSEAVVRRVARRAGLPAAKLRNRISVSAPSGAGADRARQQLVSVTVTGDAPGKVGKAATLLAGIAADDVSEFADAKIAALEAQIAAADSELASLRELVDALLESGDDVAAAILEQRRSTLLQSKLERQQLLELAKNVERARVVEPAVARKVTAQSRRNTLVVAGAIGLLIGLAAALAWEPVAARVGGRARR